jgi:hypothetical protein
MNKHKRRYAPKPLTHIWGSCVFSIFASITCQLSLAYSTHNIMKYSTHLVQRYMPHPIVMDRRLILLILHGWSIHQLWLHPLCPRTKPPTLGASPNHLPCLLLSRVTLQSMSSIRALKETKLIGNAGTCKIGVWEIFQVHFTMPIPTTGCFVPSEVWIVPLWLGGCLL